MGGIVNLSKSGLYFDELNKIRVFDPESARESSELRDECEDFVDKIRDFRQRADSFIELTDNVKKAVEEEKMRAIGTRNLLKSTNKQREAQYQQLLAVINERKLELERLRVQYDSYQQMEAEQTELIQQLLNQN